MSLYVVTRTHQYVVESNNLVEAESIVTEREGELIGNERGLHKTSGLFELSSLQGLEAELTEKEPVNGDEEMPIKRFFD